MMTKEPLCIDPFSARHRSPGSQWEPLLPPLRSLPPCKGRELKEPAECPSFLPSVRGCAPTVITLAWFNILVISHASSLTSEPAEGHGSKSSKAPSGTLATLSAHHTDPQSFPQERSRERVNWGDGLCVPGGDWSLQAPLLGDKSRNRFLSRSRMS